MIATAVWGSDWKGMPVLATCVNAAVVAIINRGNSKDAVAMHLMHCLAFIAAKHPFVIMAKHLSGASNTLANALSHDNLPLFRALLPQALPNPTPIPAELLDLLTLRKPDWT